MILNPSESEPLSKDCIRRRLDAALSSFVQQVEALEAQVRAGNYADETQARDLFLNLKLWIRWANEAEKIRAESQKVASGNHFGNDLDLAAARAGIGCRLDRLRRCCREGQISK